ncbi:photosystem II reaction center protein Psb28 [Romeria aff. gracilis LEGE 07310]|uniref:Photosystem II reaction center Psb28 protein n=1 Tax=Vasconcelosia minhoensis LEGE 07310 TaxID=915328 RepID=A0A8J7AWN9_9CYAN|nr:photosystem II reaction center protein Psb28 [Romeria gracilis]MBE9077262.1 photosystem II reaction center protein Psb28 [Romeria aff. gracilis LEGE 07310]
MAEIQFAQGVAEEVIPDVRLTRAKDGTDGTATFYFDHPKAFEEGMEITGMYLVDEEGELVSRDVNGKFVNGEPTGIEAVYVMRNQEEWDRFMRFMERYAEQNGLGFTKSEEQEGEG